MYLLGIDTETTGVSKDDEILQIAAVLLDANTFAVKETFCTLVNPQRAIHPKASEVHGISEQDVADAPLLASVWQNSPIVAWAEQSLALFGHNLAFDLRMMKRDDFKQMNVLDTLTLVQRCYPMWHNHKLQTAVANMNLPKREAHDALGDILSCADIIQAFAQMDYSLDDMLSMSCKTNLKRHYLNQILSM